MRDATNRSISLAANRKVTRKLQVGHILCRYSPRFIGDEKWPMILVQFIFLYIMKCMRAFYFDNRSILHHCYYSRVNENTCNLLKKKKRIPKNIFEINIHIWRNDIQFFDGQEQEFESSANILSRNIQILEKNSKKRSSFGSMDRSFPLADSTWKECSIIRYCYIISLFITGTMVTCTTKSTSCELISPREV